MTYLDVFANILHHIATGETPPDRPCVGCGVLFHNVLLPNATRCPDCCAKEWDEREREARKLGDCGS